MKVKIVMLAIAIVFVSCKSTSIVLTEQDDGLYLTYYNYSNNTKHVPRAYFNMFSAEYKHLSSNVFEVQTDSKEKAWYRGVVSNYLIREYKDSPESYVIINPGKNTKVKVCDLSYNYGVSKDYKYVYVRYDGQLGKSNRIKITKHKFLGENGN